MPSQTAVAVTALVTLTGVCVVMTALGMTTVAVVTLVSSIVLGVQQILHAHAASAASRTQSDPAPLMGEEHER